MTKLKKNWLEWIVFGAALILVVSTLGYLTFAGAVMGDDPPSLEVRLGTPEQRGADFVVPVTVVNHGSQTAAGVIVEVVLENGGQETARGQFEIPFAPRKALRQGRVTFKQDPRTGQLRARVMGYETP